MMHFHCGQLMQMFFFFKNDMDSESLIKLRTVHGFTSVKRTKEQSKWLNY